MKLLFVCASVLFGAGQSFGQQPMFQVTNKCQTVSRFVVTNKTVPKAVANGCGCTASRNCGAAFCKSKGGSGCPLSCPVKGVQSVDTQPTVAAPVQTFSLPQATSNCPGGRCEAPVVQDTGWYLGKNLGRRK